jgi:hypothetical protein
MRFRAFPAVADEGSTQPQARESGLSGKFYRQSGQYATGSARYGVPPQSPIRLRTIDDDGFDAFDFSWQTLPDFTSYCAFIPSGFEGAGLLERSSQPATSPAYLARGVKTECDHSHRRFYESIRGDFSAWRVGGWSQGLLRMPGILGGLALEQLPHDAIGTSDSAIVPERFPPALRPASRRRNQALHRQHGVDVRGC